MLKKWLLGRIAIFSVFTLCIIAAPQDNKANEAIPAWPDIPFEPATLGTLPKEIPVFPAFPEQYRTIPAGHIPVPESEAYKLLEERWQILFNNHPKNEVRELYKKVQAGEIQIGLIGDGNIFYFTYHPKLKYADIPEGTDVNTSVYEFTLENMRQNIEDCAHELMPTFFLSVSRLNRADAPEYVAQLMAALHHEYQHYAQSASLTAEERTKWVSRRTLGTLVLELDAKTGKIKDWNFPLCNDLWVSENNAYFAEFSLGASWGLQDKLGMVQRTGNRAAFDQAFFNNVDTFFMAQLDKKIIQLCAVNWAKLAGHPAPRALITQP